MELQVWLPADLLNMRYMENTCHLYNRDGTQSNLVKSSSEILPKKPNRGSVQTVVT